MQDFRYTTYFYNDIIKESLLNFKFQKVYLLWKVDLTINEPTNQNIYEEKWCS